jgi:hypothetical protein
MAARSPTICVLVEVKIGQRILVASEGLLHGLFDFLLVGIGEGFHAGGAFEDFELSHVHPD